MPFGTFQLGLWPGCWLCFLHVPMDHPWKRPCLEGPKIWPSIAKNLAHCLSWGFGQSAALPAALPQKFASACCNRMRKSQSHQESCQGKASSRLLQAPETKWPHKGIVIRKTWIMYPMQSPSICIVKTGQAYKVQLPQHLMLRKSFHSHAARELLPVKIICNYTARVIVCMCVRQGPARDLSTL